MHSSLGPKFCCLSHMHWLWHVYVKEEKKQVPERQQRKTKIPNSCSWSFQFPAGIQSIARIAYKHFCQAQIQYCLSGQSKANLSLTRLACCLGLKTSNMGNVNQISCVAEGQKNPYYLCWMIYCVLMAMYYTIKLQMCCSWCPDCITPHLRSRGYFDIYY